jgi:hypothetical protein
VSYNINHVHDISSGIYAKLRSSKGIKQKTKTYKVLSIVVISYSMDEYDSVSFEYENSSLDYVESVKDQMKKHTLTTKKNYAQNAYEYEDVSRSYVEEVALEESKDFTSTQGKKTYRLPGKNSNHFLSLST